MNKQAEKSVSSIQSKAFKCAKETEKLIGIDPQSYLGKEILRISRKVTELDIHIGELTSSVKQLKYELKNQSGFRKFLRKIFSN